jgi:hypothetical protein
MTPTKQQLLQEIDSLPDSLVTEALDFIAFIKARHEGQSLGDHEQSRQTESSNPASKYAHLPSSSMEPLQKQGVSPLTEAELQEADDIIGRGIARAQAAHPQAPEIIWQRFEGLRQRMTKSVNESQKG